MEYARTLLEQQPMMALFLTIAIGYLAGEINIKGFSLGVGAVLFIALAMGWFAPKSAPAPMVGTLGLALFLYGVGVQYGKQFFIGLTSAAGRRANMMALTGVLFAGAVSLLCVKFFDVKLGYALGLFAGSGTSTPTLQAAIAGCHARARTPEEVDWSEIAALYAVLLANHPSPVVALNHAAAVGMARGPERGLALLAALEATGELSGYHLMPAAKADLLRRLGLRAEAAAAYRQALERVTSPVERRYLERRLAETSP